MRSVTALLATAFAACQPTQHPKPPSTETLTPTTAALATAPDARAALTQPPKPAAVDGLTGRVIPRFDGIANDARTLDVMVRLIGTGGEPRPRLAPHQRPLQTRVAPFLWGASVSAGSSAGASSDGPSVRNSQVAAPAASAPAPSRP